MQYHQASRQKPGVCPSVSTDLTVLLREHKDRFRAMGLLFKFLFLRRWQRNVHMLDSTSSMLKLLVFRPSIVRSFSWNPYGSFCESTLVLSFSLLWKVFFHRFLPVESICSQSRVFRHWSCLSYGRLSCCHGVLMTFSLTRE